MVDFIVVSVHPYLHKSFMKKLLGLVIVIQCLLIPHNLFITLINFWLFNCVTEGVSVILLVDHYNIIGLWSPLKC